MSYEIADGMFLFNTDAIGGLAIAMLMLMVGYNLRDRVHFFERCCLPPPVIGGLLFAIINFVGHMGNFASININTTFQSPAMICFFTCIGLTADFKTIKQGGLVLFAYWGLCAFLSVAQNSLALGLSLVTGLDPVYGVLAGTTTMMGGHGNGGSFGLTAEEMGYAAGQAVGLACATYGLIAGSLSGGPFAKRLIETQNLKPSDEDIAFYSKKQNEAADAEQYGSNMHVILKTITFLALTMMIGSMIANWVSTLLGGVVLPGYVGGMFFGVFLRNLNEQIHFINLDFNVLDRISDIMLSVFLALAMSSMKLWQLIDLAVPLIIILTTQLMFLLAFARAVVYPVLKKIGGNGYDAAVMCSGLMGHGLGATPNAIANMAAVIERFGPSRKAMLVVPLVASSLIDFVMIPSIVIFFNIACNM